jgi:O-antigen/teichoic acid export membrane protein
MSLLKRNIAANLIGGILLTGLTVAITPLQINILGIEAYGIVGFVTTLQLVFTAFDFGLSSTLTRALATDQSPGKQASTKLVRTAGTIYWGSAVCVGLGLAALAGPISHHWFNASKLDATLLSQSLMVIALYLALRWPVALYTGILTGLQRMDALNLVKVASAVIRLLGGILVLVQWRDLYVFLVWTSISAVFEVVAFGFLCWRIYPSMPIKPGICTQTLRTVWRFSASMNALALLAVIIVQMDRLLISKLLPLETLGHYNLAYTAASIISLIVAAVSSAVLPSFAAEYGRHGAASLAERYRSADRIMLFLAGVAAFSLAFYGDQLLALWVNPVAASAASKPLAWLAAGFWCSAAIANVYNVAIAAGSPGRHLRANVISFLPYLFCLYLCIEALGVEGAAISWLVLNLGYAAFLVPAIHRTLLSLPTASWLRETVLPFLLLGLFTLGGTRLMAEAVFHPTKPWLYAWPFAVGLGMYFLGSWLLLGIRFQSLAHLRPASLGRPG